MSGLHVAAAKRQRDTCIEILRALDDETLEELHRRAQYAARDAFGAGGSESGVVAGGHSDPVLSVVVRDAGGRGEEPDEWRELADPVRDSIIDVFAALNQATGVLRRADRKRQYVRASAQAASGRQSTVSDCQACSRTVAGNANDRLRAGYCSACYMAWDRAGRPDRPRFERQRRGESEVAS